MAYNNQNYIIFKLYIISYVYCYVVNGSVLSLIKSCKANQYFDPNLKMCRSEVPAECSAEAPTN